MHVIGIPTGNRNGGSPRIRFYSFLENLPAGYSWEEFSGGLECDLLYVQKKSTKENIKLVQKAVARGISVVYDCDDGGGDRKKKDRNDPKMFALADVITTDTESRADSFSRTTKTPVHVVPDSIDYGLGPNDALFKSGESKVAKVVTYGTHKVLEACDKILRTVPDSYQRTYITDRKIKKLDKAGWKFYRWSLLTFPFCLCNHDLCILCHPTDEVAAFKSNNRMLVAFALGIPTIVSNTPEYRRTAIRAGTEVGIIKTTITSALSNVAESSVRNEMAAAGHAYAWSEYSAEKSSEKLAEAFYAASVQAQARR